MNSLSVYAFHQLLEHNLTVQYRASSPYIAADLVFYMFRGRTLLWTTIANHLPFKGTLGYLVCSLILF